jgi:hypothetical protein
VNFQTLVTHLAGQGSRLTHQFGGQAYVIHSPTLTRRGDERRRKVSSALRQAQRAAEMCSQLVGRSAPRFDKHSVQLICALSPSALRFDKLSAHLKCALSLSKGTCDKHRRS